MWRTDGLRLTVEMGSESHVHSCWGGSVEAMAGGAVVLFGGRCYAAIAREVWSWPWLERAARRVYRATIRFLGAFVQRLWTVCCASSW